MVAPNTQAHSIRTRMYKVGFKHAPNDLQETLDFNTAEAAYAFAITVETNGGVAVVMPGFKDEVVQRPIDPSSF